MGMISSSTFHLIMPSLMISPLDNAIFNSLVPDNAILSQLFERSTLLPLPTLVIFKICFTSCYASSLRYMRPVFCVHGQSPASSSLDARTPLMARTGLSFIGPFGTWLQCKHKLIWTTVDTMYISSTTGSIITITSEKIWRNLVVYKYPNTRYSQIFEDWVSSENHMAIKGAIEFSILTRIFLERNEREWLNFMWVVL